MEQIEAYLAELARALRGPGRAKADLLAEARGGLHDAARSYMDSGEPARVACRRAIADFGEVPAVAAAFQTELSLSQARRTAGWVALAVAVQPVVWGPLRPAADADLTAAQALIDRFIEGLGVVALSGALLALFACGTGVRFLGTRPQVARVTGVFALTVTAGFVAMACAMLASGAPDQLWVLAGLPWALMFLISPMVAVAVSARRCLAV